jgi:cell division protein FtsI/penicillin-binding protein 2
MVYIGDKMGNDKLFEFIQKFGFGSPTGIDLEGEESGYLKERDKWYPIDYATATFGQGIAVTEIQMLTALSAVVNGGHLMRPYIVYKTVNGTQVRMREVKEVRRVISDKTSADLRKMMVSVVDHGEVHWDKPKGYVIGGKTGTAQIALAGKYDASKTNASFIGFAPADDPKFIALIVLKEPQASEWGSETAAPIFFDIAKDLLAYYNIPPSN